MRHPSGWPRSAVSPGSAPGSRRAAKPSRSSLGQRSEMRRAGSLAFGNFGGGHLGRVQRLGSAQTVRRGVRPTGRKFSEMGAFDSFKEKAADAVDSQGDKI